MANTNVQGYPTSIGSKTRFTFDHYGPASYVQYSASTGAGDVVNASDLGFGGIDNAQVVWSGYSNSGNYIVQVMQSKASDVPAGGAAKRVTMQWFTVTSGAFSAISTEASAATDLHAEYVRVVADVV
jgi:hypothetical protein